MADPNQDKDYRIAEFNALRTEIITATGTVRVLFVAALAVIGALVPDAISDGTSVSIYVAAAILLLIAVAMELTYVHVAKVSRYIRTNFECGSGAMGWETSLREMRLSRPFPFNIPLYHLNFFGMLLLSSMVFAIGIYYPWPVK